MMLTATMTSKGQITIPKPIRDSLNLHMGDRISFEMGERDDVLMRPATKSVDHVYGRLARPGQTTKSVEDINAAVRRHLKARYT